MAELADALDSGSSESNFMQVQVLFPAPERFERSKRFFFVFLVDGAWRETARANVLVWGMERMAVMPEQRTFKGFKQAEYS